MSAFRTAGAWTSPKTGSVLQMNVLLPVIGPLIRRRILVPEAVSLHELHRMLQVAVGRETLHHFQFEIRGIIHAGPYMYGRPCLPGRIGSGKGNSIDEEILEFDRRADREDSGDVPNP